MKSEDLKRAALSDIIEGRESLIFDEMTADIDHFFEDYGVCKWLTLNQSATIHEILMSGDEKTVFKRLDEYCDHHLKRIPEQDKCKKTVDLFNEMIKGISKKYPSQIQEELKKRFEFPIDNKYDFIFFEYLIRTFDHIFITKLRLSKKEER